MGCRCARALVVAVSALLLAACGSPASGTPGIQSVGDLMDAVTAAGYPCDVLDDSDVPGTYGEEVNDCSPGFLQGAVTYCSTEAVCRAVISHLREHPTEVPERYLLDGGRWLVRAPYPDLQAMREQLGGSVVQVATDS